MPDWFDILMVVALFAFWVERTRTAFAGVREFTLPHPKSAADSELFGLGVPDELRRLIPEKVYQWRRVRAFAYSLVILLCLVAYLAVLFEVVRLGGRRSVGHYFILVLIISNRRVPWSRLSGMFLSKTLLNLGPNPFFVEIEDANSQKRDPRMGYVLVAAMIVTLLAPMLSPRYTTWQTILPVILMLGLISVNYLPQSMEMILTRRGVDDEHTFTGWRSVIAYHWYSARQGVVFVRRTSPHNSPLVVLPVPADKADDVERILNEKLPGKRGEDVEVSSAAT